MAEYFKPALVSKLILAWAAILFAALVLSQAHYIPIWDSAIYAECVVKAATTAWRYDNYSCVGHLSHAYLALLSIPGRFAAPSLLQLLLVNVALGLTAIASVYRIGRAILPGDSYQVDAALLASAFAVHPVMLASAVYINVDYAVCVFGVALLASLLKGSLLQAAVAGALLVFSKETGTVVYLVAVGLFLVMRSLRPPKHAVSPRLLILTLPLLLLLSHFGRDRSEPGVWENPLVVAQHAQRMTQLPSGPHLRAVGMALLVLQFGWLTSSVSLLGSLGVLGRDFVCGRKSRAIGISRPALAYVAGVTLVTALAMAWVKTDVYTRYFAFVYPLLLVLFLAAAAKGLENAWWRRGLLAIVIGAFGLSSQRTADPVSKWLYGTFPFGQHRMLNMTSVSRECCGYGVDHLVYNLEFVRFHELLDAAMRYYRPTRRQPIVIASGIAWELFKRQDPVSFGRAFPTMDSATVFGYDVFGLLHLPNLPREAYFLAMPNIESGPALAELATRYTIAETTPFDRDGYAVLGYRLTRR